MSRFLCLHLSLNERDNLTPCFFVILTDGAMTLVFCRKMRCLMWLLACALALSFSPPTTSHRRATAVFAKTPLANGAKKMEFDAGSSLSTACSRLGVPVKYNCKKGDVSLPPPASVTRLAVRHLYRQRRRQKH